jgi:hypothetical protein
VSLSSVRVADEEAECPHAVAGRLHVHVPPGRGCRLRLPRVRDRAQAMGVLAR